MTSASTALPTGPRLDDVAGLLARPGPFASVVVGFQQPGEDAAEQRRLRWQPLREELVERGAPDAAVDALEELALRPPDKHRALCAVADGDGVQLLAHHLEGPRAEYARFGDVPSLLPAVEWRQLTPPHVVVLVDRTGADVHVATPEGTTLELPVEGDHDEIRKVHPGGWATRRFQQRAEDSWERNAEQVAERVAAYAHAAAARVVILAGDVHAVPLLRDALPADVAPVVHTVENGSRQAGFDALGTDVMHWVATAAAEETVAFLERWKGETGRGALAVEGPEATIDALARAQVAVLGLHDDPGDERVAFFGPAPEHVALRPETLRDLGVDTVRQDPLRDVLLRAAVLTGADVRVIPAHGGPAEGIGALLRWA